MDGNKGVVVIFAKRPVFGKVKTRLARDIGNERAYEIYLKLINHSFQAVYSNKYDGVVFWDSSVGMSNAQIHCPYREYEQEGENLGMRMRNALNVMLRSYNKVIIIGCDCPKVNNHMLNKAFESLSTHDVVLGPAFDGGYYLIGLKTCQEDLFSGIDWGTENVYMQTNAKIIKNNLRIFSLDVLNDVDTVEDLTGYPMLYE